MDWTTLIPALKPFAKQIFDTVIVPEITKLEDQIGSAALKAVIEAVTAALEKEVDAVLS